jgi:FkbM family methyltransferase
MIITEKLKLIHRALRYRYQADKGGIRFMLDHLHPGNTALDIGAHKGGYTYWMKKGVRAEGRVIAFEPQTKGARLLEKLFNRNVKVEHLAISDKSGKRDLFIQPQEYEISFEASLENKYENAVKESVAVVTLDEYCYQHKLTPQFIKIDVEGHEQQVIKGARNILASSKPVILIECEARHIGEDAMKSIFVELINFRYDGFFFFNGKQIPIKEFRLDVHQDISLIGKFRYANNFGFVHTATSHQLITNS